jgi:glycosyltransferase involved in cell wall biosynthesis
MAVRLTPVFICNAQHIASEMVNYYKCRENKIKIVPNGIELANPIHSRSWWRTSLGVGENAFLAVMVANLSGFKDHDTLLKAWRLVINRLAIKGVDAKLLLAGKDLGTESMLRRLVDKLGMREGVKILGKVQDVSGLLRSVDLGVYSSRREGSPNGIIECMLAGLAVAATDCDGIRWVLGEHQTPWLSRSDDIEQFAKNILSLKDDMNTRILIGMQNKDRAVKEFSPDKMCRTTELLVVG